MELLPTIDALHWIADNGEAILGDERIKQPQIFFKQKKAWFSYEPLGRGGRDRALELPLVDPVRRGGDRADVRQRRGAQARLAHAADRRADPDDLRARRRARGARADCARRRRRGQRARGVERGQDLLHGVGGGGPARGHRVRRAAQGQRARARRQGPADRARGRQPRQRDLGLPVGWLRQRGPDLLGHRARLRDARRGRALHRGRGGGSTGAARGRPAVLRHRDRADGVGGAVRARRRAGGRRRGERCDAPLRRPRRGGRA